MVTAAGRTPAVRWSWRRHRRRAVVVAALALVHAAGGANTVTQTLTVSPVATTTLPTETATESAAYTVSSTYSGSESLTVSATATETATASESLTLSFPTASSSVTMSVPSDTQSATLPPATASPSLSGSGTITIPEGSDTVTETATLRSASETPSGSLEPTPSNTFSPSYTGSATGTETASVTLSRTLTLPSHDNFSTTFAPEQFAEGQEIRLRLTADFGGERTEHFNVSKPGTLQVRLLAWDPRHASDCRRAVQAKPLASFDSFGLSLTETEEGNVMVGDAHVTITAPHHTQPFIVCFLHSAEPEWNLAPELEDWVLFTAETPAGPQYVFKSLPGRMWYVLPDPTAGQYAIAQMLSDERWNMTYPASDCGSPSLSGAAQLAACNEGDSFKLVPAGAPCTYEHQQFKVPYLGSAWVQADGRWDTLALRGLLEGSVAGGVGRIGTQYANPHVDSWSAWGTVYPANAEAWVDTATTRFSYGDWRHSYVYVRVPLHAGKKYEVCYSSRYQRMHWRTLNTTVDSVPMWRKLYRCRTPPQCVAEAGGTAFEVVPEPVGWTMVDLTPNTWGTIVFDDSGQALLSNKPAATSTALTRSTPTQRYPQAPGSTANYWDPQGGDYFRVVRARLLHEVAGRQETPLAETPLGSFPNVGCWSKELDSPAAPPGNMNPAHGGWIDDGAAFAAGSRDLHGDPTDDRAFNEHDSQSAVFATLWVPPMLTRWYVCYRRTCTGRSEGCVRHTGFRVLPWHQAGRGAVPSRWIHLNDVYAPGAGRPPHQLIPFEYGADRRWDGTDPLGYPPPVVWYSNDTREGVWAPHVIETYNYTRTVVEDGGQPMLDTRRWNYQRWGQSQAPVEGCPLTGGGAECDTVMKTVGSALRLVHADKPCDYPQFTDTPEQGAESVDGGAVECNSADAGTDTVYCAGSSADSPAVFSAAFYLLVPAAGRQYRVCYRLRGWNWREVWPFTDSVGWGGPTRPSGSLQRGDWSVPDAEGMASTNAGVGPDYWYEVAASPLNTLGLVAVEEKPGAEALWIITDSAAGLSAAPRTPCPRGCDSSGDVFRVVPADGQCDINPVGWTAEAAALTDTHLSPYCPQQGSGTADLSGMYGQQPCADTPNAMALCGGVGCYAGADVELLQRLSARSPDLFDDVVPYDTSWYNVPTLAASLRLPPTPGAALKLCFKQVGAAGWVMFNSTWRLAEPSRLRVVSPTLAGGSSAVPLLAGELQRFVVDFPGHAGAEADLAEIHAKLVQLAPPGARRGNDNCLNPPASAEGFPFASHTTNATWTDGGTRLRFHLPVPQVSGRVALCLQARFSAEDSMSWLRPVTPGFEQSYDVVDSGVRWLSVEGPQPTNQGMSTVVLLRCAPLPDGTCSVALGQETFNTDPGQDAAKVVPAHSACSDGDSASGRAAEGLSLHVGVEGGGSGGITNLGPADGSADRASFTTTLPPAVNDTHTAYRVCVSTTFAVGDQRRRVWIHAPQARGEEGAVYLRDRWGFPAFVAKPARISHWQLAPALRPLSFQISGVTNGSVVIAGAATHYLDAAGAPQPGFNLTCHNASGSCFSAGVDLKLVQVKVPRTRYPPIFGDDGSWGETDEWVEVQKDACAGVEFDSASTVQECVQESPRANVTCPAVLPSDSATSAVGVFQVPVDPGMYMVCARLRPAEDEVWQQLWSADGSAALHVQPSYFEFASPTGQTASNATVYDLRTVPEGAVSVPISSWCAPPTGNVTLQQDLGATCGAAHQHDLLTVVNDTQVCPLPVADAAPPDWFRASRTANLSVSVVDTWGADAARAFALPPTYRSTTWRYKVCVYKAGDGADWEGRAVTPSGVVYQVRNRGEESQGGGTAHWKDSREGGVTQLLVSNNVVNATSLRWVEYAGAETDALYGPGVVSQEMVTDADTGAVSRTPLLPSGSTVDFTVRAATQEGRQVPNAAHAVEVLYCFGTTQWTSSSLSCNAFVAADANRTKPFAIANTAGTCSSAQSLRYGWPASAVRQFLIGGQVTFRLQYTSMCPDGAFGCGVRFRLFTAVGPVLSRPQWINIARRYPDAVTVPGGPDLAPAQLAPPLSTVGCSATSETCYVLECHHSRPCPLRLNARWRGPREYAALGKVRLEYSAADYLSDSPAPNGLWGYHLTFNGWVRNTALVHPANATGRPGNMDLAAPFASRSGDTGVAWSRSGEFSEDLLLRLRPGHDSGVLFLNVTWTSEPVTEGRWTRVLIRVVRRQPASIVVSSVRPLDLAHGLADGKTPAQEFKSNSLHSRVLHAQDGSYIEALTPYELRYKPLTAAGVAVTADMGLEGWAVDADIAGYTPPDAPMQPNRVMLVYTDGSDRLPVQNLESSPEYTNSNYSFSGRLPEADSGGWYLRFRVFSSHGCSRFAAGGGCTIEFKFSRGQELITIGLTTPVRVVGSTLRVKAETMVAPARTGLQVELIPGTPCGPGCFLPDEFHVGDVFALIDSPGPVDGVRNRDGVVFVADGATCVYEGPDGCSVSGHPTHVLGFGGVQRWGAAWALLPSKPCYRCHVTFHSTAGASPEVAEGGQAYGEIEVTLEQEEVGLLCTPAFQKVYMDATAPSSDKFVVTVGAVVQTDPSLPSSRYHRLSVSIDPADVTVTVGGSAVDGMDLKKEGQSGAIRDRMGEGATVAFTDLRFVANGRPVPEHGDPQNYVLTFTSVVEEYDPGVQGAVPMRRRVVQCEAGVGLHRTPVEVPPTVAKVESVERATPLCADAPGCQTWQTTPADLREGLAIAVSFVNVTTRGEVLDSTTQRNVTVVPGGGLGRAPRFAWDAEGGQGTTGGAGAFTTACEALESSVHSVSPAVKHGEFTYTFGRLIVEWWRGTSTQETGDQSVQQGRGLLGVKYARERFSGAGQSCALGASESTRQWPARDVRFDICGSLPAADDGGQPQYATCTPFRLWVRPSTEPSRRVAILQAPTPGRLVPGSSTCRRNVTLIEVFAVAFYEVPGVSLTRFVSYDTPLQYSLEIPGQLLIASGDELTTVRKVYVRNEVPAGLPVAEFITDTTSSEQVGARFLVYGRNPLADALRTVNMRVGARDIGAGRELGSTDTTEGYYFASLPEQYGRWRLLSGVEHDDECPAKRHLPLSDNSYRGWGAVAGRGWEYLDGAVVGVPFPLQTVVETDGGQRAWTFASGVSRPLMRVRRQAWSGCNDGGTLAVYSLRPSVDSDAGVPRPGSVAEGFAGGIGDPKSSVTVVEGVATAWPVFSAPCEACTLAVDLCFSSATRPADCLLVGPTPGEPSDQLPPLADRTKTTKPFSVLPQSTDALQVLQQTVPWPEAKVGEPFDVTLEQVRTFGGKWQMPLDNPESSTAVSAQSTWMPAEASGSDLRYGNGGYLLAADADAGPSVAACRLAPDLVVGTAAEGAVMRAFPSLRFVFTRPCSRCGVMVTYRVGSNAPAFFVLRSYYVDNSTAMERTGPVLAVHVVTCGTRWLVAGRPPRAVRKRRPFSLTVWAADAHGFPSWSGGTPVRARLLAERSNGNGGGGTLRTTSPVDLGGATPATDGAATLRLTQSRACYRCVIELGGEVQHWLTVLTEPTRWIVSPYLADPVPRQLTAAGVQGEWGMRLYAADELGDRSFLVGGPTAGAMQPLYATHAVMPLKLGVAARSAPTLGGSETLPQLLSNEDGFRISSLRDGDPLVRVAAGSSVLNGIPFGPVDGEDVVPGVVRVQLSNYSGANFPVSFTGLDAPGGMPTHHYGTLRAPRLDLSVTPAYMAIENPSQSGCASPLHEHTECSFQVFAVGKQPTDAQDSTDYYLSVLHLEDPVEAGVVCTQCSDSSISVQEKAYFTRGVARFSVKLLRADQPQCACTVTVAPQSTSLPLGVTQSFSLLFSALQLTRWLYVASPTFYPLGDVSGTQRHGFTVVNRTVELEIHAADGAARRLGPNSDRVEWRVLPPTVTLQTSATEPPGCVRCVDVAGNPAADLVQCVGRLRHGLHTRVSFTVVFAAAGQCAIPGAAVVGFPQSGTLTPTSAGADLVVRADIPDSVSVATVSGLGQLDQRPFSGLTAATAQGDPAAVVGEGADMVVQVLADGALAVGDTMTLVTVQEEGGGWAMEGTPTGGQVRFHIDTADGGPRDGATFTVNTAVSDLGRGNVSLGSVTGIGPLYFVRQPRRLKVDVRLGGQDGEWRELAGGWAPATVVGYEVDIRATVVDATGWPLTRPDEPGSDASVLLNVLGTPCSGFDVYDHSKYVLKGCTMPWSPGKCVVDHLKDLPGCGTQEWTLGGTRHDGMAELQLVNGSVRVPPLAYHGERSGTARFLLSTDDFPGGSYTFVGELVFQRLADLALNGSTCAALVPGQAERVCELPSFLTDFSVGSSGFSLSVFVADPVGNPVAGDDLSEIRVQSRCEEPGQTSYVGVMVDGELDTLAPVRSVTKGGVAEVGPLFFSGFCERMVLVMFCETGEGALGGGCGSLARLRTRQFNVSGSGPRLYPPPFEVQMAVNTFSRGTAAEARADFLVWAATVDRGSYEAALFPVLKDGVQMVQTVRAQLLCAVPTARAGSPPQPTDMQPEGSPDGGMCNDVTVSGAGGGRWAEALQNSTAAPTGSPVMSVTLSPAASADLVAVTVFTVLPDPLAAGVSGSALTAAVEQTMIKDLASPQSRLRNSTAFAAADVSSLYFFTTVIGTPAPTLGEGESYAPDTPAPETPAPQTPPPPPPPEPTWPTPNPLPPDTTPDEGDVSETDAAAAALPSIAAALVLAGAQIYSGV